MRNTLNPLKTWHKSTETQQTTDKRATASNSSNSILISQIIDNLHSIWCSILDKKNFHQDKNRKKTLSRDSSSRTGRHVKDAAADYLGYREQPKNWERQIDTIIQTVWQQPATETQTTKRKQTVSSANKRQWQRRLCYIVASFVFLPK